MIPLRIGKGAVYIYRMLLLSATLCATHSELTAGVDYLHPPERWNGINYSPRRHSYFRMLYDWDTVDSGQPVSQMVVADLTMLRANGFNLVHLYLWDKTLLQGNSDPGAKPRNIAEPAGFCPSPSHPSGGVDCDATGQWKALQSFVAAAEDAGLYVALHFASGRLLRNIQSGVAPEATAAEFAPWAGAFISALAPRHNILLWGLNFAVGPNPDDLGSSASSTWSEVYFRLDALARANSPNPGTMGLIGTNMAFPFSSSTEDRPVVPRSSPFGFYAWDWHLTQRQAKTCRDLLTARYGYPKDPDIYMIQAYTANASDLEGELRKLTTEPYDSRVAMAVRPERIFVTEFGTGSSVKEPWLPAQPIVRGNDVPSFGDANTPTSTPSGQAQWLRNVLCAYAGAQIGKIAYWSLYDSYATFSGAPYYYWGVRLAWWGYWGLIYQQEGDGEKPGWPVLVDYYRSGAPPCPADRQPSVTLKSGSDYYTTGQPIELIWTNADSTSLTVTDLSPDAQTFACDNSNTRRAVAKGAEGSCAYAFARPAAETGNRTYSVTAVNNGTLSSTASVTVTVGAAPVVRSVTTSGYSRLIHTNDSILVSGDGFGVEGHNTLRFTRPGYNDVWMFSGDDHLFLDESYQRIYISLDSRLAPGEWFLSVMNPFSPSLSAPVKVDVLP